MSSQESNASRVSTIVFVVVTVGTNIALIAATEHGKLVRLGLSLLAALVVAIVAEVIVGRRE